MTVARSRRPGAAAPAKKKSRSAAGARRSAGPEVPAEDLLHLVATDAGTLGIVSRGGVIRRVLLPGAEGRDVAERLAKEGFSAAIAPAPSAIKPVVQALQRYFKGGAIDPATLDAKLDYGEVTPFTRAIYDALRRVPRGSVTSYGELAARAGKPRAARAVGGAMARNPLPLLVPCHRVLAHGVKIGGFSAPGGLDQKRDLLRLEGWLAESEARS